MIPEFAMWCDLLEEGIGMEGMFALRLFCRALVSDGMFSRGPAGWERSRYGDGDTGYRHRQRLRWEHGNGIRNGFVGLGGGTADWNRRGDGRGDGEIDEITPWRRHSPGDGAL